MEMDQDTAQPSNALNQLVTYRLARLQARANAQAAKILKKHAGISLSEWRIFVMIETNGQITPAQIVRLTQFDKGLVSRTIKKMHQKGLVRIEDTGSDKRSHVLDFTPDGLSLFQKARPAMRRRQEMLISALEPDEFTALFRSFDKLDDVLNHMEPDL